MAGLRHLFPQTVNVLRKTAVLLDGVTVPVNSTLNSTLPQIGSLQATVQDAAAEVVVTGQLDGVTRSETIIFSAAQLVKQSTQDYDFISTIVCTTGSGAVEIKRVTLDGQPIFSDTTIYSSVRCRLLPSPGRLDLSGGAVIATDRMIMVTEQAGIRRKDKIVDSANSENYEVEDVNEMYDLRKVNHYEIPVRRIT